jgi:hypothetical protein
MKAATTVRGLNRQILHRANSVAIGRKPDITQTSSWLHYSIGVGCQY